MNDQINAYICDQISSLMKQVYLSLFVFFITGIANAQTAIKAGEISQHIGDSVTICGKVNDLRYFESSKNSPTFLNIDGKFPNQVLTVVIWGETRKQFTGKIEDMKGKQICITGKLILYKERPEIIIGSPEQISVQ